LQNNSASPPDCYGNLQSLPGSITTQEDYLFAQDGKFYVSVKIGTGGCPLDYTKATVLFIVDAEGSYTNLGNNTNIGQGWEKVVYHPTTFYATITKGGSGQPTYFTEDLIGPCMLMSQYLSNEEYGCPCNGTWTAAPITSGTTSSATRVINDTTCPMVNLTNGTRGTSCPENRFFNRADRYGSVRVTNTSNGTRFLEITQPLLDNTSGWNSTVVYQSYSADYSCPSTIKKNDTSPTPGSSSATRLVFVVPYFFAVWVIGGLAFVVH